MSYVNVVHNTVFWSIQTWTWRLSCWTISIYMRCKSERRYLTGKTDPSLRRSDLGKGKEISGIREILGFTWKMTRSLGGNLQPKKMSSRSCQIGMFCLWPQGLIFEFLQNHNLDDDLLRKNPQVMEEEQPLKRCESEIFQKKARHTTRI